MSAGFSNAIWMIGSTILLDREDLALKGRVTLIEQDRLAVNGPEFLQQQIAGILDELRGSESDSALDNTTYRVRYWILTMRRGEQTEDLPAPLSSIAPSLEAEFPDHALSISDFMESYHYGASRNQTIESSAGGRAQLYRIAANDSGARSRLHSYCSTDWRGGANSAIHRQTFAD